MDNFPKIIVLHVLKGYEARAEHIEQMMAHAGLEFEYMLKGDIADLSPAVLDAYFKGPIAAPTALASCTYKHLLACRRIVDENLPGAIVMEDDVVIFKDFVPVVRQALAEMQSMHDRPVIASLEDTRLRFVPRSRRVKGRVLYPGDRDRLAGCYYINRAGAKAVLDFAEVYKIDRPIDLTHRLMLDLGKIAYLWAQPAVATQGSFTGLFPSSLSTRYSRLATPVVWRIKLHYRKLLYWLR